MAKRVNFHAALIALTAAVLFGGCAKPNKAGQIEADRLAAEQHAFDVPAHKLMLTPAQQDKLATVYKWEAQQTAAKPLAVGKAGLFIDEGGDIVERPATGEDVDKSVLGTGMPVDPKAIHSAVDVRVRSILSADQYAMYKNDLTTDEKTALATGLRDGMRSTK